jgi:putative zinc finger/helix-turn-helix YgiT family protein
MKCFQCGKARLINKETEIVGEVRGESVKVRMEALVCGRCGFQAFDDEQSKAYTIASADAYRRAHGLLTTVELRRLREKLNLSQQGFAHFLKVGIASIKRWEAGLVQDEAMDELIRLKTDLDTARGNVDRLEAALDVHSLPAPNPLRYVTVSRRPRKRAEWKSPEQSPIDLTLVSDTCFLA